MPKRPQAKHLRCSLFKKSPQKIEVQVDTLDSICSELNVTDIDFAKIDVGKTEIQALIGAEKVIDRAKKVVVATYRTPDGENHLQSLSNS